MRQSAGWVVAIPVLTAIAGCSRTNSVARRNANLVFRLPRKIARGTVNVVSAPLEILNQPVRLAEKEKSFMRQVSGVVAGVPVGVGYGVGRVFAGTFDIATAPATIPARALIEAEFTSPHLLDWAFGE